LVHISWKDIDGRPTGEKVWMVAWAMTRQRQRGRCPSSTKVNFNQAGAGDAVCPHNGTRIFFSALLFSTLRKEGPSPVSHSIIQLMEKKTQIMMRG
jgi:hypothetical protein